MALEQRADFAGAWHNYGVVLWKLGRTSEAEAALRRATELAPDLLPPAGADDWHLLGNLANQQGRHDEAIQLMRESLRRHGSNAIVHNDLGVALASKGAMEEAAASFRQAIALRPDYIDAHINLGALLGRQGRLDDAVACYGKVL